MKKYGIAVKAPKAKRVSKFEWFGTEMMRDFAAKAARASGYKVRKLKRKMI